MTKAQEKAVERIKTMAKKDLFFGDNWEIKKFEVTELEYFVSVYVQTGIVGDEGTLASIVARDSCHLFIGKRGGITYPYTGRNGWTRKSLQGHSLLKVVIDQKI